MSDYSFKDYDDADDSDDDSDASKDSGISDFFEDTCTRDTASGDIKVSLRKDEMKYIKELAEERNESYMDGTTENTVYGDSNDSLAIHIRGIMAEYALAELFNEASVDTEVYEFGDDGTDSQLRLDGELLDVDIKATKWGSTSGSADSWCMLKEEYKGKADGYVVAHVPEGKNCVIFKGWLTDAELCSEENLTESKYGHMNYTVKSDEKYNNMPEPDSGRGLII